MYIWFVRFSNQFIIVCSWNNENYDKLTNGLTETQVEQGSGAEDSVGPHSGKPVLLWPTMKIWIVCFHF